MKGKISNCSECDSEYFTNSSEMTNLCPECAHKIYGYQNCDHEFKGGSCIKCFWNGKQSAYLKKKSNGQ